MKPKNKRIDIVVTDNSTKIKACKALREHTSQSYSELLEAIEHSKPAFTATLIPDQVYSGIDNVCSVINRLEEKNIPYDLFINGKIDVKESILKIKNEVKSLLLKDFR